VKNRALPLLLLLLPATVTTAHGADSCPPIPDMFCVSQQVVSHLRNGHTDTARQMFVYRFRAGDKVEIAQGNPPVTKTEDLLCVENRTYKGLMVYAFADGWQQGVAAFIDPGMSTIEFLNCAPDESPGR